MIKPELDFSSEIPLYMQLTEILTTELLTKGFKVNDPFYTEKELLSRFNTSSITIKRAMSILVKRDLIYRQRKKGSFVKSLQIAENGKLIGKDLVKTILFIFPKTVKYAEVNFFYSSLLMQMELSLSLRKFRSEIYTSGVSEIKDDEIFSRIKEKKFAGIFLIGGSFSKKIVDRVRFSGLPAVVVDSLDLWSDCYSINIENLLSAKTMTEYLIQNGHKDILFFGVRNHPISAERETGFLSALREAGLDAHPDRIRRWKGFEFEGGTSLMQTVLDERKILPTAIFAANDAMAIAAMKTAMMNGLTVPNDISFVGFDNVPMASQMHPGLTTMDVPLEEIGKNSIRLLFGQMDNVKIQEPNIRIRSRLVERESVKKMGNV